MFFQFIETVPSIVNQLLVCKNACKNVYVCKNVFRKKAIDWRTLILAEYSSTGIKSLNAPFWMMHRFIASSLSPAERDD